MGVFIQIGELLQKTLRVLCPPVHTAIFSNYEDHRTLKKCLGFIWGFGLGLLVYQFLLKSIPFPFYTKSILMLTICVLLGFANAFSIQMRCVSLLTLPMYCGKAGRGALKAVVLTYVIAGPISNLGLNAREVVRVFACSTSLSYNLTRTRYALMMKPFQQALYGMKTNIAEVKDTMRAIRDVAAPIESEIEGTDEMKQVREENDYIDNVFGDTHRDQQIDSKFESRSGDEEKDVYEKMYLKKLEYRCQDQLSRGTAICIEGFASAYDKCHEKMPWYAGWLLCWPMRLTFVCNIVHVIGGQRICDSRKQMDPGLGEGYAYFKKSTAELGRSFKDVKLQYHVSEFRELVDIQDAKETGKRVLHSFDEKDGLMKSAIAVVNACFALIFIRIFLAAQNYHDKYLTVIEYDNIYITGYFRKIDARRKLRHKYTVLPMKKMERAKYIDLHSVKYVTVERHRLLCQMLKLFLEVVTATTFVMLDRLFYEALEVVRAHADVEYTQTGAHDLQIEVEGTGMVAGIVRNVLGGLNSKTRVRRTVSNKPCLPNPHLMSSQYFVRIYGGYLWILVLIYFDAYTLRLRRLFCSYFYRKREKQRVLHLYNDLLKKRMKMKRTLRRNATQAVRARRLAGEGLRSLRLRFPCLLGWLRYLPAARDKCLICGETQPRTRFFLDIAMLCMQNVCPTAKSEGEGEGEGEGEAWAPCPAGRCPAVYCPECWADVGRRCLACDPALRELSDVDSLSEDEPSPD